MEEFSINEFLPSFCSSLYLIFLMEGLFKNIKKIRKYRSLNVKGNRFLKNLIYKETKRILYVYLYTAIVFTCQMLIASDKNMILSVIIVVTLLYCAIMVAIFGFPENIRSHRSPRLPRLPVSSIQNQLRENSVQRNKWQQYKEFASFSYLLLGLAPFLIFVVWSKVNENIMIVCFISLSVVFFIVELNKNPLDDIFEQLYQNEITRGEKHENEECNCHLRQSRENSITSPATSSRVSESSSIQQPKSVNVSESILSTTQTNTNRGVTTVVGGVINNDSSLSIQLVQNKDQKAPQNIQDFKSSEEVPKWFSTHMKKLKTYFSSKITKICETFDEGIKNLNETGTNREIKLNEVFAFCTTEIRKKVNKDISKISTQLEVKLEVVVQKFSEIKREAKLKGEFSRSISDQEYKYKKELFKVYSNMQKMLEDVKISIVDDAETRLKTIIKNSFSKAQNELKEDRAKVMLRLEERINESAEKLKSINSESKVSEILTECSKTAQ
ncbi:UNVERIFIED_CONTAM: hypothetical protein RMT77_006562 [Armadillidium vulgare]